MADGFSVRCQVGPGHARTMELRQETDFDLSSAVCRNPISTRGQVSFGGLFPQPHHYHRWPNLEISCLIQVEAPLWGKSILNSYSYHPLSPFNCLSFSSLLNSHNYLAYNSYLGLIFNFQEGLILAEQLHTIAWLYFYILWTQAIASFPKHALMLSDYVSLSSSPWISATEETNPKCLAFLVPLVIYTTSPSGLCISASGLQKPERNGRAQEQFRPRSSAL